MCACVFVSVRERESEKQINNIPFDLLKGSLPGEENWKTSCTYYILWMIKQTRERRFVPIYYRHE